jgi:hypothetical protein
MPGGWPEGDRPERETRQEWAVRYTTPRGDTWVAEADEDQARARAATPQLSGATVELLTRTVTVRYGKWRNVTSSNLPGGQAEPVLDGWNRCGYWVGVHAEPSLADQHAAGLRVVKARCMGPDGGCGCGHQVVTPWQPGRHHRT